MQYIIDFVDFIYNTVTSLWDMLVGFVQNLILLLQYLGVVANICYSAIATMPGWLQVFGTVTVIVSVLYMILGRSSGGTKE